MAVEPLVLAVNPGSASRKYALYKSEVCKASVHFEYENGTITTTLLYGKTEVEIKGLVHHLDDSAAVLMQLFVDHKVLKSDQHIAGIGIRVVAPSSYFLENRFLDDESLAKLDALVARAPLHIATTLQEVKKLKELFAGVPIFAVSDSAFHAQKPDYAWNYGIDLHVADAHEIKRFGYHGISVESIVQILAKHKTFEDKLIVCHLGSGSSVTAVANGISIDTTMGYSPLEGLVMATRSGSLDAAAVLALKRELGLDDAAIEATLNQHSGLRGISGFSDDIRELLQAEASGNYRAKLALAVYVYNVQKAIGQMAAVLGGVDTLVFTGTVGARSAPIRNRVLEKLDFLGLASQPQKNEAVYEPSIPTKINPRTRLKSVYVVTTDEAYEIAWRTSRALR